MKMTTVGIVLAKTVFQIHGEDNYGKLVLRKKLDRSMMLEFFICPIGTSRKFVLRRVQLIVHLYQSALSDLQDSCGSRFFP